VYAVHHLYYIKMFLPGKNVLPTKKFYPVKIFLPGKYFSPDENIFTR